MRDLCKLTEEDIYDIKPLDSMNDLLVTKTSLCIVHKSCWGKEVCWMYGWNILHYTSGVYPIREQRQSLRSIKGTSTILDDTRAGLTRFSCRRTCSFPGESTWGTPSECSSSMRLSQSSPIWSRRWMHICQTASPRRSYIALPIPQVNYGDVR